VVREQNVWNWDWHDGDFEVTNNDKINYVNYINNCINYKREGVWCRVIMILRLFKNWICKDLNIRLETLK
jgi:hypothetical protein